MIPVDREKDLGDLTEELVECVRRGDSVDLEEYAAKHPHLAEDLFEIAPAVLAMEGLRRDLSPPDVDGHTLRGPALEQLGDYRIIREIGRGGMGIVYEAEQCSLGRPVALKVVPRVGASSSVQSVRFRREAETVSRLHHTNIVPVFDVGTDEGFDFFAMQLIHGAGLNDVIDELRAPGRAGSGDPTATSSDAGLSASEAVRAIRAGGVGQLRGRTPGASGVDYWRCVARIALQVAEALEYAHSQNICHRDIKPANLILDANGIIWVTDFGIAKIGNRETVTEAGSFIGTLQYAPPEQLSGQFDARSDVYSLGLTLYELATLEPAFDARDQVALIRQVGESSITAPRLVRPDIPRDLETIITRATARDAAQRYQSGAALAEDLDRFLHDRPLNARRITAIERLWRVCRRNQTLTVVSLVAVAAVLAALIGGWISTSRALDRERAQARRVAVAKREAESSLVEAVNEGRRAESNLDLSLLMANDVFSSIMGGDRSPHDLTMLPDAIGDGRMTEPPSEREVELLERILLFYHRFAADNASNEKLAVETARATRRVGDIQSRIGHLAEARAAYERAIKLFERLPPNPAAPHGYELATIHGCLGDDSALSGRRRGAESSYRSALSVLQSIEGDASRKRFHQAEIYGSLAVLLARPSAGFRPSRRGLAEAYGRQALEFALVLADPDVLDPDVQLLIGRSRRNLAGILTLRRKNDEASVETNEAIQVMRKLTSVYEGLPRFRYELAEACALKGAIATSLASPDTELACREAIEIGEDLVDAHSDSPRYRDSLARHLGTLAKLRSRSSAHVEASSLLRDAISHREALIQRFPAAPRHVWELVKLRRSLASELEILGQSDASRELLEICIDEVSEFVSLHPDSARMQHLLPSLRDASSGRDNRLRTPNDSSRRRARSSRKAAGRRRPFRRRLR